MKRLSLCFSAAAILLALPVSLLAADPPNTPPDIPSELLPANGETRRGVHAESFDFDGDPITFDYELYADEFMTELLASPVGYGGWWKPDVPEGETYWWRVRADDGIEKSEYTQLQSFICDWSTCCRGIRGNANYDPDDKTNVADVSYLVTWMFGNPSGPGPVCREESNANGDLSNATSVSDISYLVAYLFGIPSRPAPPSCPW